MSYRPSSKEPTTAWARHLDAVRRERDWSATQLFEAVAPKLGLGPKSRSAFVDRLHLDPRPSYVPALRELFGDPPEEAQSTASPVAATPDAGLAALVKTLIKEQQDTRAMLEAVLLRLSGGPAPIDRDELEAFFAWKREHESTVTRDRRPDETQDRVPA